MITGTTRIYAHLAHPSAHVRATGTMNEAFAARGLDAASVSIDVAPDDLPAVVAALRGWRNLAGAGVTMPHKVPIASLVDRLTPAASRAGSVNNIRREPDGSLVGTNTDGIGFVRSLQDAGHEVAGRRVLLVGLGGAGRALAWALADAAPAGLALNDLRDGFADALASSIAEAFPGIEVSAAPAVADAGFDVVVNATPIGLDGDEDLAIAGIDALPSHALVADIVMTHDDTALIRAARARGLTTHVGMQMLDAQTAIVLEFLGFAGDE